jgi:ribonuclease HI
MSLKTQTMKRSMASIFCDGACSANGTRNAKAGWAWAYWPGRAVGEPAHNGGGVPIAPATNQRAELTAILEALRWWRGLDGGSMTLYTDSMYSINCMTTWGPGWKRKGWKRVGNEPLQNLDLIVPMVDLWAAEAAGRGWQIQHVRGHQTGSSPEAWGNNYVDRLAVVAAGGSAVSAYTTPVAAYITSESTVAQASRAATQPTTARTTEIPKLSNPFVSPKLQPVRQSTLDFWFGK